MSAANPCMTRNYPQTLPVALRTTLVFCGGCPCCCVPSYFDVSTYVLRTKCRYAYITSREVPCAFEGKKTQKKRKKIRPVQNTPRNLQPPGDRDQLETARGETRPTREPILARFLHRSRFCGNWPRAALAISKKTTNATHTYTD